MIVCDVPDFYFTRNGATEIAQGLSASISQWTIKWKYVTVSDRHDTFIILKLVS